RCRIRDSPIDYSGRDQDFRAGGHRVAENAGDLPLRTPLPPVQAGSVRSIEQHLGLQRSDFMSSNLPTPPASKAMLGTGRVISGLAALFLLMDGTMKLFKPSFVVNKTV